MYRGRFPGPGQQAHLLGADQRQGHVPSPHSPFHHVSPHHGAFKSPKEASLMGQYARYTHTLVTGSTLCADLLSIPLSLGLLSYIFPCSCLHLGFNSHFQDMQLRGRNNTMWYHSPGGRLLHPSSPGARQANTPNGNRVHNTVASPGMSHAKPSPYAYTNGAAVTSGSAHKAIKHEDPPEEDQVGHYQVEIGLPSSLAASYPTSYFHISLVTTVWLLMKRTQHCLVSTRTASCMCIECVVWCAYACLQNGDEETLQEQQ